MSRRKAAGGIERREAGAVPTVYIQSLISDLKCNDVFLCRRARRELVLMGDEAIPYLVDALAHRKGWIRWEATKALGEIQGESATDALVSALKDSNFDIRWLAAEGLIQRGRGALPRLLRALIENSDSVHLREGAHHVLHDSVDARVRSLAQPLLRTLEGVDSAVMAPALARSLLETVERETHEIR